MVSLLTVLFQGPIGPRGDTGPAGPPGPPVSSVHRNGMYLTSTSLPDIYLCVHLLQGLPAAGIAPLPERGRRRRTHTEVDGAALENEEEETVDGGEEEWIQGDQAKQNGWEKEKEEKGMEEVFASLSSMKVEVEGLRNPQGTYLNPARTCKELWLLHPELPNGI